MRVPAIFLAVAAAAAITAPAVPASAHTVKMLNKGAAGTMVFENAILRIKPGESVTFTPDDMGHNVESIPGMLPAGAQSFKGQMSKTLTVTFTRPGVYGFKCAPHLGMGMVGLVVVGNPVNLAQARTVTLPGRAQRVMSDLLARVQ